MSEETKQEFGQESEDRCDDKHWHKHHHKRRGNVYAGQGFGVLWCIGWLFSIGYLQMPFFWKGVLAIIIWPYYLGLSLSKLPV
jgi:hypothetical protein